MPASHEFVVNGNNCSIDLKIYYENTSNKKKHSHENFEPKIFATFFII
jgi:hypothetical protein